MKVILKSTKLIRRLAKRTSAATSSDVIHGHTDKTVGPSDARTAHH
jgi:hypothetical protein